MQKPWPITIFNTNIQFEWCGRVAVKVNTRPENDSQPCINNWFSVCNPLAKLDYVLLFGRRRKRENVWFLYVDL